MSQVFDHKPISHRRLGNLELFRLLSGMVMLGGLFFALPATGGSAIDEPSLIVYNRAKSSKYLNNAWIPLTLGCTGLGLSFFWGYRFCYSQKEKQRLEAVVKRQQLELEQSKFESENQVNSQITALQSSNQAKSDLLSHISHELRTPLSVIQGYSQLLQQDGCLTPQQQGDLAVIARTNQYLMTLFDEILEISSIQAGKASLKLTCFNIRCLIQDILEMLQVKAQGKGLRLQSSIEPDVPQYIKADRNKLQQILVNLLENAIKFTEIGCVTLRIAGSDSLWSVEEEGLFSVDDAYALFFEVEDTGMGMETEKLSQIFEPFQRGNFASGMVKGSGLGLFICQQLIQLMGGYLQVNSIVGQGTLFQGKVEVNIPETTEIPLASPHLAVVGLAAHQPDYRLLIVDDKVENRQLLKRLLTPLGFQIQEATNGEDAITLWHEWQPNLIFMDTRMPKMDGYQAIEQINNEIQSHSTIIIAVVSGKLDTPQTNLLLNNCHDILRKPFDLEILLAKIATHLHVQYRYALPEENLLRHHWAGETKITLTSADLANLSDSWKVSVYQAASAGHSNKLTELIQQIPSEQTELIDQLKYLIYHFNFRKIRKITQLEKEEN